MSDAHDELALLPHAVDELHRDEARVVRVRELPRGAVQRAAEPVSLRKHTTHLAFVCFRHFALDRSRATYAGKLRCDAPLGDRRRDTNTTLVPAPQLQVAPCASIRDGFFTV